MQDSAEVAGIPASLESIVYSVNLRICSWIQLAICKLLFICCVFDLVFIKEGIILAAVGWVHYHSFKIFIIVVLFLLVPSSRDMDLPRVAFVDIEEQNIYWVI